MMMNDSNNNAEFYQCHTNLVRLKVMGDQFHDIIWS